MKDLRLLYPSIVLFYYFTIPSVVAETVKYFKIDRITNCEPADQFPVTMLPDYSIHTSSGENSFNCTIRIREEIKGPLKYEANIKRCEMDLSKCEFFNTLEANELCQNFENVAFTDRFLNSVTPAFKCPVQPGDYVFTNTTWDLSAIVNLPGSAYRWKIVTTIRQSTTDRVVYCTEMMSRIVIIRRKSNRIKH